MDAFHIGCVTIVAATGHVTYHGCRGDSVINEVSRSWLGILSDI